MSSVEFTHEKIAEYLAGSPTFEDFCDLTVSQLKSIACYLGMDVPPQVRKVPLINLIMNEVNDEPVTDMVEETVEGRDPTVAVEEGDEFTAALTPAGSTATSPSCLTTPRPCPFSTRENGISTEYCESN